MNTRTKTQSKKCKTNIAAPVAPSLPALELNPDVLQLLYELVWEEVEDSAEYKEVYAARYVAIDKVYAECGFEVGTAMENAPIEAARLFGIAMLKLGLQVGRNPETLLTLPASKKAW
jgi:hypothetical protein